MVDVNQFRNAMALLGGAAGVWVLLHPASFVVQPWRAQQSVTGSRDAPDEPWATTAQREVLEETGIDVAAPGHTLTDWATENIYEIYPRWRHRYAPGVTRNTERLFGLCVPQPHAVTLSPREHRDQVWLPWAEAADRCFSPSNAEAVLQLPRRRALAG